ncbi:phage terminase small subunit P27 family [Larkinella ripae]
MRPAKPTEIKKLQGTARADRTLGNEMQPTSVSLPQAPDWLSEFAKEEWYVVTSELEALGMLTKVDLFMLSNYCQQCGIIRQANEQMQNDPDWSDLVIATPNGALQPNPLLGIINKASDIVLKIAGQFGFTPSARTRIGVQKKIEEEDPFEAFLTGNVAISARHTRPEPLG